MLLHFEPINYEHKDVIKVKYLYETAFPREERPTFEMLMSFDKQTMYAIYDEDKFVGLVDLVEYLDLIYIFFLAIESNLRGKGYGGEVLRILLDKYKDKRVYLLSEQIGEQYLNNKERIKRISFYEHHGMIRTGLDAYELGIYYHILSNNTKVDANDFYNTMEYLLGEELFNEIYH